MFRRLRVALVLVAIMSVPVVGHAASITFGASVSQIVEGPTTYTFTFTTPVTPAFYTEATSLGSLTLTPGQNGQATVEVGGVHPYYLSGTGLLGLVPTNLGVDQGTAPCVAVRGPVTCDFALLTNSFAPTFFDGFQAQLTFQLTGAGAFAEWTGAFTLEESASVPEPASALLLGMGVLAALRARRRK